MATQVKAHVLGGVLVRAHVEPCPGSGRQFTTTGVDVLLAGGAPEGGIRFEGAVSSRPPYRTASAASVRPGGTR
jgi:hypothetical protein